MDTINAIAKARFSSARPQRVQLHEGSGISSCLICMEPNQKLVVEKGEWTYYVVTGAVDIAADSDAHPLPTGQMAATAAGEKHTLATGGERRAVILAVGTS
ncbi:MAG: cupin domain-containing protein [Phycisphaerae bacterium]